ncbi:DUF4142 domain-containing protein [Bradyrhizobium arachidis]|jgi:putative membrane protein|uniref:DUF4142 domain-containing protein n=1 Tax=Bradyrhizobium arachidis TaxID=858423 RepID=UPI0008EA6D37|nr:DUF4142 domain-containing protein [Bradyrhizobium arachidis]SFV18947.1 protein of unknown function [Bradyrhizobium arachidis]
MSDMLEIEAAKIALQKGNPDEKKFADQMITDHTKTSSDLKEMVPTESKVPTGSRCSLIVVRSVLDRIRMRP